MTNNTDILSLIQHFIQSHKLIDANLPVLVALSGGADSVALTLVLSKLHYNITALHCNFHLRGKESDRDEHFVTCFCLKHGIPLRVKHFDTANYASKKSISIEMAARELRYEWFEEVRREMEAGCIAVAHHKDDQAETILLNLIRGTGLRGLTGMHPSREFIVRPFLCVTRQDIIDFLQEESQDFVTDSTNLEREATRNILRLDIMPQLRQINPSVTTSLSETCDIIQQSLTIYQTGLKVIFSRLGISQEIFPISVLNEPMASTLLFEWLKDKHFTSSQLSSMLSATSMQAGRIWESSTHKVLRDRANLILSIQKIKAESPIKLRQEIVTTITDRSSSCAYFDADLINEPITLRHPLQGDFFIPFGMTGRKLISNFLTDRKLTIFQKENQWLALSGKDIIWVVGLRSDNRYRVTEHTKRILKLEIV